LDLPWAPVKGADKCPAAIDYNITTLADALR